MAKRKPKSDTATTEEVLRYLEIAKQLSEQIAPPRQDPSDQVVAMINAVTYDKSAFMDYVRAEIEAYLMTIGKWPKKDLPIPPTGDIT